MRLAPQIQAFTWILWNCSIPTHRQVVRSLVNWTRPDLLTLEMETLSVVAGGTSGSTLDLVELFNPNTQTSCVITGKLDQPRAVHTGDGNLVCAGMTSVGPDGDDISSCYNVATGDTINLLNGRNSHTSWSTDAGIYLLGGSSNLRTAELVTGDTTLAGFGLQYDTE